MKNIFFSIVSGFSLLIALGACGDNADFLTGGDRFTIDVVSLADGDILVRDQRSQTVDAAQTGSNYIFFRIRGDETKSASLSLLVELFSVTGESIARNEKTAPAVNADLPIELSSRLSPGQYDLVLSLSRDDLLLVREQRSFFLVSQAVSIHGIQSYPLVIFPSNTALLIAEVTEPAGLDPYLRWTEGNRVIARGLLSDGYNQILWEAPREDGVYSVRVEVFPFPPGRGADYAFASPHSASSELFISQKRKTAVSEQRDERKEKLLYNLFDIYISALREREKMFNAPAGENEQRYPKNLKRPYPVILGDTIGMRFAGQAGFVCPELIFPIRTKPFKPFTLSLGMTLDGEQAGRQVLSLLTSDGQLAFDYFFNKEGELVLRLKIKTDEYFFPSGITKLESGVRYLVDFTINQGNGSLRALWKLNGITVTETEQNVSLGQGEKKGYTVVGGENGIRCVVDTLDILLE